MASNEKRFRSGRMTKEQKEYLADYMVANVEVAQRRFWPGFNEREYKLKFAELAKNLNDLGPPIKTAEQWMKVWADQRLSAKRKASNMRRSQTKTNDSEDEPIQFLDSTSSKIVSVSSKKKSCPRISNTEEFGLECSTNINVTLPDEDMLVSEEIYSVDEDNNEKISQPIETKQNLFESFDAPTTSTPANSNIFKPTKKALRITELFQRPQDSYLKRIIENTDAQTTAFKNLENLFSAFIDNYSNRNIIEERKAIALEKLAESLSKK